jgi:DNA-binding SARP family transcriptional activator
MELGRGDVKAASRNVETALAGDFANASAHLRSQYLKYHAFLLALDEDGDKATTAAEEALALRQESGGNYFETITGNIVASTYARIGHTERAESYYDWGLERSENTGDHFQRASLFANRAGMRLNQGEHDSALKDIGAMLAILKQHNYRYLYFSTPELMTRLLAEAVRCGIETDYARQLAAERYDTAILDDGRTIPLMKFITLGRLELECAGKTILQTADFSAIQRQLLEILLAAPGQQLHQEQIQLSLWPDASTSKARSSFDNLISRFRKLLDKALGEFSAKNYLVLKKGILSLNNSRSDFADFASHAEKGLAHIRKKEFWQADNCLHTAIQYWRGSFLPDIALSDDAEQKRQDLLLLYLDVIQNWSEILVAGGRVVDAITFCTAALKHEPTHELLNRSLYNLHVNNGDLISARKVLAAYTNALRDNGFSPEESAEILDAFWTPVD